ncbi:MAG: DNA mismatch repair endonuclease MutL [Dehalococcoidia bacterium]|jgi:DNA mismatch repair protein MutL|nr:DNA mismatch repair endonuclease MutL [Dehalococcoidia bacterium]
MFELIYLNLLPIKILNKETAAKISAGEVVERPASVVKELVENSLDAGSKKIQVHVESGGLKSIKVIDDGMGIKKSEIKTAFERFATSKIDDDSDLIDVRTMGFRGEALPSIASVSEIVMSTRQKNAKNGWSITLNEGIPVKTKPVGIPFGTEVEVLNLFHNTPGRLKFMDSPRTETSKIKSIISSIALTRPFVSFSLFVDGNRRLFTFGNGNIMDLVCSLFGIQSRDHLLILNSTDESEFKFKGLVSYQGLYRGNRNYMNFSVNGRCVQSQRLKFAVERSYRGLIPDRRFPISVINIETPLGDVDVNVHPSKSEVRFLRENLVFSLLSKSVHNVINNISLSENNNVLSTVAAPMKFNLDAIHNDRETTNVKSLPLLAPNDDRRLIFRILGQIKKTYLIVESGNSFFLIDQHAAHERIVYDSMMKDYTNNKKMSQALFDNTVITLTTSQKEKLLEHIETFNNVGWLIEDFGDELILVRAIPVNIKNDLNSFNVKDLLTTAIDQMSVDRDRRNWEEDMFALLACHSSVRAGQKLSWNEMNALVSQLESTDYPQSCPHGRPTMIEYDYKTVAKKFLRT